MKALLIATALTILSAHAQASTIHATGSTNLSAPCGNEFARSVAEREADKNANAQCASDTTRATPYSYNCQVYAHGYVTINIASAEYNCK